MTRQTKSITVAKGDLLTLERGAYLEIGCESGSLWITQDNDVRDVVLAAGERFVSDREGTVVVHALQPAVITASVGPTRTAASPWSALVRKLRPALPNRGLAMS